MIAPAGPKDDDYYVGVELIRQSDLLSAQILELEEGSLHPHLQAVEGEKLLRNEQEPEVPDQAEGDFSVSQL